MSLRGSLCAAVAVIGAVAGVAPVEAETLRLSHHHAVDGHLDQTAHRFKRLVEERTDGAVTVEVFPAAQLGQEREAFEQLNQGIIDMTLTSVALMDRYWPPIEVTSLPFVCQSWDQADRAVEGTVGEFIIEGMLENSNARLLGIITAGFRDMVFRREPVTTVAGLEGMRMRAPEAHVWIRMFELLGARPTPITWGGIYTAMETGVAEGLEAPSLSLVDMALQEVTESLVLTQHMFLTYALAIDQDRFGGLPPEVQEVVLEAGGEATRWSSAFAREANEAAYAEMESAGVEIVEPEDPAEWAAAMQPLWDEITAQHPDSPELLQLLLESE